MKGLLKTLFILAIALGIGLILHQYPGWISISFAGWRVDLPFWIGCILLFFLYFAFYFLWRVLAAIFSIPKKLQSLSKSFRRHQAKKLTQKGFVDFATGDFKRAEQALIKGAPLSEMPWLNYLHAAKAAQEQGAEERRDHYLKLAGQSTPSDIATGLTQARLQFQEEQYAQSLETLKVLMAKAPNHPMVLKQLEEVYVALGAWESLSHLLPKLKRFRILSKTEFEVLENKVWLEILRNHEQSNKQTLNAIWKEMPKHLHDTPDIAHSYAKTLDSLGESAQAEQVLVHALKKQWNNELVKLYGFISHVSPQNSLNTAESWLKLHSDSPELYLTLGRLCRELELWGKSQRYFEASITLNPDSQTYAELGLLLDKMNKPELGARYFKKGLLLKTPKNTNAILDPKKTS